MTKGIYRENTPLETALKIWTERLDKENVGALPGESVPVRSSLHRITASSVSAKISSPFYHSSAMDGYAVRFADTFGSSETTPKVLKIGEQAFYVDTGDPIPDGFDSVVMIEDVNLVQIGGGDSDAIEIIEPTTPWQHVRVIGEDIVSTELIIPENHRIRPVDIGAVISGGYVDLMVRRRPKVAIIPTGSELVEPGTALKTGNIIEFNSGILSALVTEWGGEPIRFEPVPDDLELIKNAILKGCETCDLVVVNAGSSAGSEDYTSKAISFLGEIILHGVDIKPGKPVILGWAAHKPLLGIPGYPVSAYITFNLFAKSLIYRMQGLEMPEPETMNARLSRQIASSLGQEEFVRVKLGKVGDNLIATPVSRGAGVLMSLVRADGFIRIPSMSEGFGAGAEVNVEMLRRGFEIENTVVCIGSHDNALDILANILKKRFHKFSLSSAHVGSLGGLIALKKNEAHIAGTHLLDEETGEYNISYLRNVFGKRKITLINLVYRQQGFVVPRGNPLNIKEFRDLQRKEVRFINRQSGSGTRLLTDKHLKELGISHNEVCGYDREEYTHMGVASAVLTGIADTGLAILAAANALGLDFVPVAKERYDIAIPAEHFKLPQISALLKIIREDDEFRREVEKLGGYDISDMGKLIYES